MNERLTLQSHCLPHGLRPGSLSSHPLPSFRNAALPSESWEHHDTKQAVAALTLGVCVTEIVTVNSQGRAMTPNLLSSLLILW